MSNTESSTEKSWPQVGELLAARGQSLFVIEAGAGGVVCAAATESPGASRWFAGGVVAYGDGLKRGWLSVEPEVIVKHGAVSAEVVAAMVEGAPEEFHWVWAESGIYGPGGSRPNKPVGTVHFALRDPQGVVHDKSAQMSGDRRQMRSQIQQLGAAFVLEHMLLQAPR